MVKRQVRQYEKEFKETIKSLYFSGKSIKALSSEYGLPVSTVRQWVVYDVEKVNSDQSSPISEDMELIKKELLSLKEENAILKKALTIFAKK